MSKSCRRNDSGELDVFEAALYFSGEVNEASLIGIQRTRRWVTERRSVDTAPRPSREAMEVIFQPLTKSESKSKDKGERQPCPPGGKLANFIRSFFNQVISKKKASEYVEKHRKSRERCRKSTSLLLQREIWRDDRSYKATKKCCYENARAAPPGEALIAKGEWPYGKTEEEDGRGSDSSSDLFELQFTTLNSKSYLSQGP